MNFLTFKHHLAWTISSALTTVLVAGCGGSASSPVYTYTKASTLTTATPIKHLVVIYGENVSFDHYFGTYPTASNPAGQPQFTASSNTPAVNGLSTALLTSNPNFTNSLNGTQAGNPFRLDRTQAATVDQDHSYTAEQLAYDKGAVDLFPKYTNVISSSNPALYRTNGLVMGYYDGNTVTALWNYAQRFAMNDSAYTDTFGASTQGALEAVSGQTNGMQIVVSNQQPFALVSAATSGYYGSYYVNDGQGGYTLISDVDPGYDSCSNSANQVLMTGKNIGDLLTTANISWGGFMGGFNLSSTNADGSTGCNRATRSTLNDTSVKDYIPHHNWFQYYKSTSNPNHARPSSVQAVGFSLQSDGVTADPANHQYDLQDFYAALQAGNFPAVSYLKAPAYQDAHAGYSNPLDEQTLVTQLLNFLQQQPEWSSTLVIVTYDDSDGWYDHAFAATTSASFDSQADQLNGPGICGQGVAFSGLLGKPVNGRCGPGTRIPFLMISPWAKSNFVDHSQISQGSIVRFIEDNWLSGARIGGGSFDASAGSLLGMLNTTGPASSIPLYLDETYGTPLNTAPYVY